MAKQWSLFVAHVSTSYPHSIPFLTANSKWLLRQETCYLRASKVSRDACEYAIPAPNTRKEPKMQEKQKASVKANKKRKHKESSKTKDRTHYDTESSPHSKLCQTQPKASTEIDAPWVHYHPKEPRRTPKNSGHHLTYLRSTITVTIFCLSLILILSKHFYYPEPALNKLDKHLIKNIPPPWHS